MNLSELLYKLDCDYGDDLPMYAQTERFGERWHPVIGIVADENDSTITLVAAPENEPKRMYSTAFEHGQMGSWARHLDCADAELLGYELMLSFTFDASGALLPVAGSFSFVEDESDEESLVFYPAG